MSQVVKRTAKGDMLLIMGGFSAKEGARDPSVITFVIGRHGMGVVNEAGEQLQDFCVENELALTNTVFQHHQRWRRTWTSPDGKTFESDRLHQR